MSVRRVALGGLLVALLPVAGSAPAHPVRALAPVELVADGLDEPRGVAVDPDGTLFVADRSRGTVVRVNADGSRSVVARRLRHPFGLAVDAEARVLVTEESGGRLLRLDLAGPQPLAGGLVRPRWVAIGDDGTIYVVVRSIAAADDGRDLDAIVAIGPDGRVSVFADQLHDVGGLVANGRAVYVAMRTSSAYAAIRRYAIGADGRAGAAAWIGPRDVVRRTGGLARDRLGALWLSAAEADIRGARLRDVLVKLSGGGATLFAQAPDDPRDLTFGPAGHLYVSDTRAGRILRFQPPPAPTLAALPEAVPGTALAVRGTATPESRIDVFVNDAELPATTATGVDGTFEAVVVLAPNTESHLEVFATAARGEGLSSAATLASIVHDGDDPDLAFARPMPAAFVRGRVDVEVLARDAGSGLVQASLDAAGRVLQPVAAPPLPASETRLIAAWDTLDTVDGAATLVARAVDRAGNERTAARVVVVDNTPPGVDIAEGPTGDVSESVMAFRFTGHDNLTPAGNLVFAWRVDGDAFTGFSSATAATVGPLTPGPHRFEVKARDLAGNESAAPTVRTFSVSPGPTITAIVPAGATVGSAITVLGERLAPGPIAVAFNGIPAAVRRLSTSSLLTSVPPGATSGALTVVTARGAASRPFSVDESQDIALRAVPGSLRTVPGLPVTAIIRLDDIGAQPFTGLATLRVQQAPEGVATSLSAGALTGGRSTTLTILPASSLASSGTIVIEATAVVAGGIVRRAAQLELDVLAGHHTALGGRLLLVDDTPIVGAQLTLAGTTLGTDAGGHFLFVDPPPGRHMLGLDVNAARAGLPIYAVDVEIVGGSATELPVLRITPPPPPEQFVRIDNAARDQIITDDRFPAFALTLPAGVTIVGWDGALKQQVAVEKLSPDGLPVPAPAFPTRSFYQVFFGTPMGGLPSRPLPITLPNDQDLEPGEAAEIWYYDAAPIPGVAAGWRLAGDATVSADGTRVVSNAGVGLARFCGVCGVACIKRKVAGQPNVDLKGVRAGDPVDLATGLLIIEKTDLALSSRVPAFVHRVYNAVDPFGRVAGFELPTGPGWTLSTDVALIDDGGDARLLIMPGNARVPFARTGEGTFANDTTPDLAGAVLQTEPAGQHRLVFKDGAAWRFRSGWRARGRLGLLTGLGLMVEQRDRHGNALTIDRDDFGAVASVTEPSGRTLTFRTALLDAADPMSARLVSVLDPLGRTVHYGYDVARRLSAVTDAAGGVVRYTYDAAGRISTVTDPRDITYLTNEYDAAGRVVRQVQADGGVWRFDYEGPAGAHTGATVRDPRGAVTTHRFAGGRPILTVDAVGQSTRLARDPGGRVTSVTDSLGRTVAFDYDARGDVARVTDPLHHAREIVHDATGRVRSLTDALGHVTRLEYDTAGRLLASVDAANTRVTFEVDGGGRPVAVTDAAGATTRLEYARTGDVVAVVDPLGRRTTLEYDAASRLIRRRDSLGGVVTIAYDELDRVVQFTDATGTVRYEYDANGNLLSVTDPLGRDVRYRYDAMDRRIAKTDGVGMTEHYEYDTMGNVVRVIDRKGQATVYHYDLLGRRVAAEHADGATTEFTYDAGGRLVRAVATGQAVLLEYDVLDRLTAETTTLGTTRYVRDALGRRTIMTRPDGTTVAYTYDAGSRLSRLVRGTQTVDVEYDEAGRRRRMAFPGGVEAEYTHDAASRLTSLSYRRGAHSLGSLAYTYDDLDRRIGASGSLAVGLLPEAFESAVYDDANRQLRVGEHRLSYDPNGNLTTWAGPAGTWAFTWDAQDRLAATSGPSDMLSFAYDALGRRTVRAGVGGITAFAYDVTDVVEDVSMDGERSYLRGTTPDELFAVDATPALTDALGSVVGLVDADGTLRATLGYEPFGRTSSASSATRYGFTGRERETDDLYYYRARYYHAGLGRFISEDPLGIAAGVNSYVYAFNDPVNLVDPTGLRTYVVHGIWPDRAAFDDFAVELQTADPATRTLAWSGNVFGGIVPSTRGVAGSLMPQILADLAARPLEAGEKLNLIGFSGGGLVSATLAEMLRARGVKVDTVISMGTPAQTPLTTRVPSETRLMNFIGVFDPLVSFRLHPRGTNYLVLATHSARSYTENGPLLALIRREIAR
jgi:RHS repeat-associated protein